MGLIDSFIDKKALARAEETIKVVEARRKTEISALLASHGVQPPVVDRILALSSQVSTLRAAAASATGVLGDIINKVADKLA